MLPIPSGADWSKPGSGGAVQASARMVFNIEQPVVLSRTPFIELERGRFSVQAGADGTADRRLVLEGAVLRLEAGRVATLLPMDDALSPLMAQLATLGMDRVLIRGATVRVSADPNGRVGPIDADVDLTSRGQIALRGVAIFHGDALSFEVTAGRDPEVDGNPRGANQMRPVSAAIKGENLGEVVFEGELSSRGGLAGNVDARLASPAALMRWLGTPVRQAAALRNVSLSGRVRWLDGMLDLQQDARLILDGQRPASGALRLRYRNGRPIIEGTLAFASLDLTRLGAGDEATAGPSAPQSPSQPSAGQPSAGQPSAGQPSAGQPSGGQGGPFRALLAALTRDLPAYLDIDADLRVSATTIMLRGGVRGRGAATITVDSGLLSAELADVEWAGNKARLHIDAGGQSWRPTFGVRGRVDLLQAQDVLTPLLGQGLVIGPASLTLDLQGRGEGPNLLPGAMTGKVSVVAVPGTRSLLDPFKVTERTVAKPIREVPLLLGTAQAIEALDLRLFLGERAILVEQSQMRTAGGTARLSGQIDRSSAALDLLVSRSVRPRAAARSGAAPETAEQTFAITGSWAAPSVVQVAPP